MRSAFTIFLFCALTSCAYSIDIEHFNKYIGQYKAIEYESYSWKEEHGQYKKIKDENFYPDKLQISLDSHETKGKRFVIEYDGDFFMRISNQNVSFFDIDENRFSIQESNTIDEITFLTNDLIRIKCIWEDENYPCGISFYKSILYQRITE